MDVIGIDFTSAPTRRKPLTCLYCTFDGSVLRAGDLEEWAAFSAFEQALQNPGPWIAGIDFPFGQSRKFIETIGWPANWRGYYRVRVWIPSQRKRVVKTTKATDRVEEIDFSRDRGRDAIHCRWD